MAEGFGVFLTAEHAKNTKLDEHKRTKQTKVARWVGVVETFGRTGTFGGGPGYFKMFVRVHSFFGKELDYRWMRRSSGLRLSFCGEFVFRFKTRKRIARKFPSNS